MSVEPLLRRMWTTSLVTTTCALVIVVGSACGDDSEQPWQIVHQGLPGALLSVWGTSADDVWAVGGDARDGTGPVVLHLDGGAWDRVSTGQTTGDLWWVFGFAAGPVFMGGSGGVILRYQGGDFAVLDTPGTDTVFGLWGSSPDDMWAVGGTSDAGGGFAWRLQGDTWSAEPSLPAEVATTGALWKIHGTSGSDAWLVGSSGLAFYWDGQTLEPSDTGVGSSLFTVFGNGERYAAVGGLATGIVVENDGSGWTNVTPDPLPLSLSGVCLDPLGAGYAVGFYGGVLRRDATGWQPEQLGFGLDENLHGVWIDPEGGVWAAGGNTFISPLTAGVLIHKGDPVIDEL